MTPQMGRGSPEAKIMLVGEAWGENEECTGEPFSGTSGQELNRILHEAGIMRSECYTTNVVNLRPPFNDLTKWIPEKKSDISSIHVDLLGKKVHPYVKVGYDILLREISMVKPKVIVALGNTPLWALGGVKGVLKWRGSILPYGDSQFLIPTLHPAYVLRQWEGRVLMVNDLKRARRQLTNPVTPPKWNFILSPSLPQVFDVIEGLYLRMQGGEVLWIDLDIETVGGHIRCLGLSWSRCDAVCIPFATNGLHVHYWKTPEEEGMVVYSLYKLLTHKNVRVRWQNGLYDAQYIYRHWHFIPRNGQDTMLSHHAMWAGMPKSLSFQASLYCEHYIYWKEMYRTATLKAGE